LIRGKSSARIVIASDREEEAMAEIPRWRLRGDWFDVPDEA